MFKLAYRLSFCRLYRTSTLVPPMPGVIIDGKAVAENIRCEIKAEVEVLRARIGRVPGLASVIVGDRKDSETYVRLKHKAAVECGFHSFNIALPAEATHEEVAESIHRLNNNEDCNGIIVQLPLPPHLVEHDILECISPIKDADALLPINVGLLHSRGREPLFLPCTPAGVIELLKRSNVAIAGARAVVLGRSNIVGAPLAALLTRHDATVTVVHSRTSIEDIKNIVGSADIVVSAMGKPRFVRGEWIKCGAAVIDVGTTPVVDASKKSGYHLEGDVCFDEAVERAGCITPVPGGVGPMTIALLLHNTLKGFKHAHACDK